MRFVFSEPWEYSRKRPIEIHYSPSRKVHPALGMIGVGIALCAQYMTHSTAVVKLQAQRIRVEYVYEYRFHVGTREHKYYSCSTYWYCSVPCQVWYGVAYKCSWLIHDFFFFTHPPEHMTCLSAIIHILRV